MPERQARCRAATRARLRGSARRLNSPVEAPADRRLVGGRQGFRATSQCSTILPFATRNMSNQVVV